MTATRVHLEDAAGAPVCRAPGAMRITLTTRRADVTCKRCLALMAKAAPARNPGGARIAWRPLVVGGELSPTVKRYASNVSGAYAVRRASDGEVVYVGESSHGQLWKTILRHFHAPESFKRKRASFAVASPDAYEVALWVTSKGRRARSSGKAPDQKALDAQAAWIARLNPTKNKDDGLAYPADWDDFDDEAGWAGGEDRVINPSSPRTALGRVTEIRYLVAGTRREKAIRWPYGKAPTLVYGSGPACLLIVFDAVRARAATPAEIKEYRRTHWGETGARAGFSGEVAQGPFRELGQSTSITYTTRKGAEGKGELVDYVHAWGDGAKGAWRPPLVVVHACKDAKCKGSGDVALRGGTYRVTAHGIVG